MSKPRNKKKEAKPLFQCPYCENIVLILKEGKTQQECIDSHFAVCEKFPDRV